MLNFELGITFLLIFARIGAFIVATPIFGGPNTPGPVKAGMAFVVSLLMLPLVPVVQQDIDGGLPGFILALLREFGVGFLAGYLCQLVLQVMNIAGQIVDIHIGFLMSTYFDPAVGGQITLTAKFLYLLGIVLFFILDGHHMLMLGLAKSFDIVPLNTAMLSGDGMLALVKAFARMITVAVQISTPVIAVVIIIDVCLGLMGRTAPQMNIFMLGFPLKIGAGILTMAVMAPLMGVVFRSLFRMMESDLYVLLKGLGQGG